MSTPSRYRLNVRALRARFPDAPQHLLLSLRQLTYEHDLSIDAGELQLLVNKWYITHAGLLKIAYRNHCDAIEVEPALELSFPSDNRWVFRATVRKSDGQTYDGYGDADPSNVGAKMHGAELRIAETRAVNRALRKAYGIGLCSAEELGAEASSSFAEMKKDGNSSNNGRVKEMCVRNRLVTLIRSHQLDSEQVKRCAAEYCRTETLRNADRKLVEAFVGKMELWANQDLDGLRKHLAGYGKPESQEAA